MSPERFSGPLPRPPSRRTERTRTPLGPPERPGGAAGRPLAPEAAAEATIYALRDPRDGEIRYVGKTSQPVWHRVRSHLYAAHHKGRTYREKWLRGLLLDGVLPIVEVLETVEGDWRSRERYWIARLRREGVRLVNLTDGGDGGAGRSVPAAERARRSASWNVAAREAAAERLRRQRPTINAARLEGLARRSADDNAETVRRAWADGKYASRRARSERRAAEVFLRDALRAGRRPSAELKREAARLGIGHVVLRRTRVSLGITYERERSLLAVGRSGSVSYWRWPEGSHVL